VNLLSCIDKILDRRSIRQYKKKPVPEDIKAKILEAGRRAPSAANRQPWHFIVCDEAASKEKLSNERWSGLIKNCSFAVIGVSLPSDETSNKFGVIDTSIALQNMTIAAEVQGVGSCWVGDFREDYLKKEFAIPEEATIVCIVAFGLPDEKPGKRTLKPLAQMVHSNKW
jgi:nitroreductase